MTLSSETLALSYSFSCHFCFHLLSNLDEVELVDFRQQGLGPQVSVVEVVLLPQKVPQVAELRELNDDVDGTFLGADAQQVDDVPVVADDLHQVHLRHQVDQVAVGVAVFQHLDRHDVAAQFPGQEGLCLDNL